MRASFCSLLLLVPVVVSSQPYSGPSILVRDGWEGFPAVEYQGGDGTMPKKRTGMLVLTDSTLGFYSCPYDCEHDSKKPKFFDKPIFRLPLASVKEVSSSSQVRGATFGSKLMLGAFAGDRTEEFFGFVYESSTSAEAPVFKTMKAQSGAIEAKVKFRLKKLGLTVPPST